MMLFNKEEGITLIEILLGITLLAIVLVPIFSFFGNSAKIIQQTDIREKALYIAQQTIEELKVVDFDELESEAENFTDSLTVGDRYPVFERDINISPIEANLKEITVIISWDNDTQDITLKTRVTGR